MDGAEVDVLEETDEVSLAGLLQGHDGRALEVQIGLEVLRNLTNETLEEQLADEKLGALLVTTDVMESDCSRPVTVRFLDSYGGRCALSGRLGSELLPRGLASGGLASGLLRTRHLFLSGRLSTTMRTSELSVQNAMAGWTDGVDV